VSERRKLTLERTFKASPEEVWELWTTREGIESWWGPEGFSVEVETLDLRPSGELVYAMTATGTDQIEYMVKAGMPLTTRNRITFLEVEPPGRLVYKNLVEFIPDVEPYEVVTELELSPADDGVHLVISFDAMHDDAWTRMARLGHESELARLEALLAARQ
jgi:uncharacterized protein YndB with AHSA1/START domain